MIRVHCDECDKEIQGGMRIEALYRGPASGGPDPTPPNLRYVCISCARTILASPVFIMGLSSVRIFPIKTSDFRCYADDPDEKEDE